VEFDVPAGGNVECHIFYSGGVRVAAPSRRPAIGDSSAGLKLTGIHLDGDRLTVDADVSGPEESSIEIQTPWKIGDVQGGSVTPLADGWSRLTFGDIVATEKVQYSHHRMTLDLHLP